MRIVCLPIDSRPCNTQFIRRLVEWAGSELILPRPEEMDDFVRPADFNDTLRFLERELPGADAAVISLDHFCYGSLLASREESVTEAEALGRVSRLRSLLLRCPGLPVYLSTVVIRSSLSVLSAGDLDVWQAVTDYSVYSDRAERFHLPEDEARLRAAEDRIPPAVLKRMLRVRGRNLRVNLAAVNLAGEGLLAGLSILQEDCQEYGLPRKDQRAIESRLRELSLDRLHVRNGADEAGAVLAAQALRAGLPPLKAEIRWLGDGGFIAPFEDRPFSENLRLACLETGIRQTSGSDIVILVCCPESGETQDERKPVPPERLKACAEAADQAVREGRQVYLLDLFHANGGVPGLLQAMREADGLWGYSAWNTASNAAGTLLAQIISDAVAGKPSRAFFEERLLDDLMYQGHIRAILDESLTALGEDIYRLKDKARAESLLCDLYSQEMPRCWPLRSIPNYHVSLPWSRTFEVRAEIL